MTKRDQLAARIARLDHTNLMRAFETSGRAFDADPRGDMAGAHTVMLDLLGDRAIALDIPLCPSCGIPTQIDWHSKILHDMDGTPAGQLADALTTAAVTAHQEAAS